MRGDERGGTDGTGSSTSIAEDGVQPDEGRGSRDGIPVHPFRSREANGGARRNRWDPLRGRDLRSTLGYPSFLLPRGPWGWDLPLSHLIGGRWIRPDHDRKWMGMDSTPLHPSFLLPRSVSLWCTDLSYETFPSTFPSMGMVVGVPWIPSHPTHPTRKGKGSGFAHTNVSIVIWSVGKKSLAAPPTTKHSAMQTVACAPTRATLRIHRGRAGNRRASVVVRAEEKEAPAAAPEKPKWTEPTLDPNTPSPIFGGSTGGLLRKAQVRAKNSPREQEKIKQNAMRDDGRREKRNTKERTRGNTIVHPW